jgi:uracil-DNA glycosylase family 4
LSQPFPPAQSTLLPAEMASKHTLRTAASTLVCVWHTFNGMSGQERVRRMILQQLEVLHAAGVQQIGALPAAPPAPASRGTPVRSVASVAEAPRSRQPVVASPTLSEYESMPRKSASVAKTLPIVDGESLKSVPYSKPCLSRDERLEAFTKMQKEVAGCIACQELVRNRSRTVFGDGNVTPRVVFFGEAPGADEDKQGLPFVGRAGQLLTKIIEACTFKREEVYIMNVLKCRPPSNRVPEPDEVRNCRHFFERQFDILQPEYIVCVGVTPAQALLETTLSIGKLRGRFHSYRDSKVVATYHPAYLLRNPDAKKYVWEDMQMMLRDMGIDPAAARKQ